MVFLVLFPYLLDCVMNYHGELINLLSLNESMHFKDLFKNISKHTRPINNYKGFFLMDLRWDFEEHSQQYSTCSEHKTHNFLHA